MGTLTLTQLKDEVRAGLGGRADLDTRLTTFLNLSQQRLARIHDFDEMEVISTTTISNTGIDNDKYISLPSLREMYSIRVLDTASGSNSRKLEPVPARRWDKLIPEPEWFSRRIPSKYTVWGTIVELFPLPDLTYNVELRRTKWPTAFLDASPTLTSDFMEKDEILIELALVIAYRSLRMLDEVEKRVPYLRSLLSEVVNIDRVKPDQLIAPEGEYLRSSGGAMSDYWADPFIRSSP